MGTLIERDERMFVFLPTVHCMCTCHSVLSHLGSLGKISNISCSLSSYFLESWLIWKERVSVIEIV